MNAIEQMFELEREEALEVTLESGYDWTQDDVTEEAMDKFATHQRMKRQHIARYHPSVDPFECPINPYEY
jgi:hypothetical protein